MTAVLFVECALILCLSLCLYVLEAYIMEALMEVAVVMYGDNVHFKRYAGALQQGVSNSISINCRLIAEPFRLVSVRLTLSETAPDSCRDQITS